MTSWNSWLGPRLGARLRLDGGPADFLDLGGIEVAVRARRRLHREHAGQLFRRDQADVVQGDDPRQVGDVGGERADVVVAAGDADRDWQLGVVVLDDDLARTEQLELEAAAEASL